MILNTAKATKKPVKVNHPLTNEFLKTMRSKNISVCRISQNFYRVEHPCLPAIFQFHPFGRVGVQPVYRSSKKFFFRAEVMADSMDELLMKCMKLGVLNTKDHERYFKGKP